jgi:O-antigen/teichoic acid export membrane protein
VLLNSPPAAVITGRNWWKKVLSGLAALCSGQVISMVSTVAVVPIFLSHWAVERYGEWLALSSLIAYLSALDLGMNLAGSNRLTQEYARGDMDAYTRCLRSSMAFYVAVASAGTLLLGTAVCLIPISKWLGLRVTNPRDAAIVVFLIGMQVLWGMPAGYTTGIYRTMGDLARTQWVNNITTIATLAFTVILLLSGAGMIELAVVPISCLAVTVIGVLVDLRRRHPSMVPGISGAHFAVVRVLVRPSLLFGLMTLATAITVQGPVLLISAQLGGAAVALFVSSRTLSNLARQAVSTINLALWPHVTALDAQGQLSRVRLLHRFWVISSTALCVSIASTLWFEGVDVIGLWTKGRISPDIVLLRLLLIQLVLQAPWLASSLITGASNQHGKLAYAYIYSSVLTLGVAAALLGHLGVSAIPIGGIVGEGLVCYHFVIRDTCRKIGEAYWKFAVRQWAYLGVASALAMLTAWGVHNIAVGPALLRWAEVGAAAVTSSLAALWMIGFGSDDRRQLKSAFQLISA